jgi:hypothetical protein
VNGFDAVLRHGVLVEAGEGEPAARADHGAFEPQRVQPCATVRPDTDTDAVARRRAGCQARAEPLRIRDRCLEWLAGADLRTVR